MSGADDTPKEWDLFICHASEDKEDFVKPLALALKTAGLRIWYDEFAVRLGDSLRRSIDRGLVTSHFAVVVLSHAFFQKEWPQYELDGLVGRERLGVKVILPIWHGVSMDDVSRYSPSLAGRLAAKSTAGMETIVDAILAVIQETNSHKSSLSKSQKQRPRLDLLRHGPRIDD